MKTLDQQRRLWRRATAALAVAALAAVAFPVASWAGGGGPFTDVDAGHVFVNEISEVANAGVAQGYEDGSYRPANAVTRQAMAAFLSRAGSSISTINGGATSITSTTNTTVRNLLIDVPGNNSDTSQYVHLEGVIRIVDDPASAGCNPTCVVSARVRHVTPPASDGPDTFFTLTTHADDNVIYDTLVVDHVFEINGGGELFELQARYAFSDGGAVDIGIGSSTLTATVIPFSAALLL